MKTWKEMTNEEKHDAVKKMVLENKTIREIAETLKTTQGAITCFQQKQGLSKRELSILYRGSAKCNIGLWHQMDTKELISYVKSAILNGISRHAIAANLGIAISTLTIFQEKHKIRNKDLGLSRCPWARLKLGENSKTQSIDPSTPWKKMSFQERLGSVEAGIWSVKS